ncbi:MAG: sugar phosphate isomerase/epimerase [Thaumarchaeota archaeon]|nr:sugar phosphate isomerase/epimerase [Nitrososphaerota archaeon]
MQFAFSTNAFKNYPLEDSIRTIASIGYEGVELLCDRPHAFPPDMGEGDVRSIRRLLASQNVKISNLNAFTLFACGDTYHPSWIEDDWESRDYRLQHTIECLKLAGKIGASNVSTEPGGPLRGTGNNGIPQLEKLFAEGLTLASKAAEREGVKILVEPEPALLLENSRQFKNFMKQVHSDYVRLNFDIGHFFCVGEDPAELVFELSDYIEHFHLADIAGDLTHYHLIPGHGAIDFGKIFDAIRGIGYGGFVTVELYTYQDNPAEAAREAFDYLSGIAK